MPGANIAGVGQALDASLNTIIAEANLLSEPRGVVKHTATAMPLKPGEGASKVVLNYGRLSAYAITEGVDINQAQELSDVQTTYTPGEIQVQVLLSRLSLRRVSDRRLMQNVGEMMASAYERKEDQDGVGQFSSFTATIGASGTVATLGHVMAVSDRLGYGDNLTAPEPAPLPWFAVFHNNCLAAIQSRLIPLAAGPGATTLGAAGVMSAAMPGGGSNEKGMAILAGKGAGSLFGFGTVVPDPNISLSGTDAVNGMYSQRGLVFVSEMEPETDKEWLPNSRSWELTMVGSYAWGVYRPAAYGFAGTFDATAPTS